ncbi:sugar kinase [Streptomyces sp. NPDC085932]|uniref:sugar kinase n=1 Tax=Streptomyces sp. NPDC085932 TaxID=3365741 RepID=UPI0037D1E6B6
MTEVLTLGESMVAVRTDASLRLGGTAHLSIAGSESNVAIGLARLGHDVAWMGAVGDDEPGQLVRRTLRAEGVDTRFIRTAPESFTGFIAFDQPTHDITRVSYHRRGAAGSTLTADESVAAVTAASPTLLHLTGITPALSGTARDAVLKAARTAHMRGTPVSLDVNYRARLWPRSEAATTLRELLPFVHTVFASRDELDLLTEASPPAAALLAHGVTEIVVTAGAEGAWLHTADDKLHQPALPVGVVNSVGAGDAFVAGYLSAVLDDQQYDARLARAAVAGAFCVGAHGDWEALPTRADLELFAHGQGTALR